MKKTVFLLNLALAVASLAQRALAQGGVPLWTNRYNGPGFNSDFANAAAVAANGNVLVTGYSYGAGSSSDYTTIAYSSLGVPLWTNRYAGPGNSSDNATAVAVGSNGNVFVTGGSSASGNTSGFATIAYTAAGVPLWTNHYSRPANDGDTATAVAVDGSGNVFVTGRSYGSGTFADFATIAYTGEGLPLWTNVYNGAGNGSDFGRAVAVDVGGNVFVTGASVKSTGSFDYATLAYSGAGATLWTNRYDGNLSDEATAVALDENGNVIVTGRSYTGGFSGDNYATVKYSGMGTPLWTNQYNGPGNRTDFANAVAVDGDGNVFVTGSSVGSDGSYDYATIAYSGAGIPLWTNRYGTVGSGDDFANAMAVDCSGNVFVTGRSSNGTNNDYATIAYASAGVPLWTNRYNGPGNSEDRGVSVTVDSRGNVFVTGGSTGTGSGYDFATIKYSSSLRDHLDIQRANNEVVLSWTKVDFGLQSAPALTGAFTNIPGATSPYTNPIASGQQFFRLISN